MVGLRSGLVPLLLLLSATKSIAVVQFSTPRLSIREVSGPLQLQLQRTESTAATITVRMMTLDQFTSRTTSVPGSCQNTLADIGITNPSSVDPAETSDFGGPETVEVQFAAGEMTQSLDITAFNDRIAEREEVFFAVIDTNAGENCTALIRIMDNDAVTVGFNASDATLTVSPVDFNYTRLAILKTGSNEVDFSVGIEVRSPAVSGDDILLPITSFTFSSDDDSILFPITIIDRDNNTEPTENFVLCVLEKSPPITVNIGGDGQPECFTLTLVDDDDLHIGLTRGLRNVKHIEVTEGATQEVCLGFLNGTYVSSDFIELNVSVSETEAGTLGSGRRLEVLPGVRILGNPINIINIGNMNTTLQYGRSITEICFTVRANENTVIDGSAFFPLNVVLVGTSVRLRIPIILETANQTFVAVDNDAAMFSLMPESEMRLNLREGGAPNPSLFTVTKAGAVSNVSFTLSFGTQPSQEGSDFTFTSFEFGPSIVSQSYSIILIDDRIPEPAKNYDIVLVNVTSAREGVLPPVIQPGSARVRIYDNDFAVGFDRSEVSISKGTYFSLQFGILQPSGSDVDPQASLPFTLEIRREDEPQGEITLNVSRTSATLDSEMQQVSLQLGTPATEDCIQGVRYRISYTYNGPTSYSVIFTVNGSVVITVDDIDNCITTAPGGTMDPTTAPGGTMDPTTAPGGTMDPTTAPGGTMDPNIGAGKVSVCVPCIVVPIVVFLFLVLLILLILLICCCCKRCWHTYDPQQREKKYGDNRQYYEEVSL